MLSTPILLNNVRISDAFYSFLYDLFMTAPPFFQTESIESVTARCLNLVNFSSFSIGVKWSRLAQRYEKEKSKTSAQ